MTTLPEDRGLLLLRRAVRVGLVTALLLTALSLALFDWVFSLSVFLGGTFAVANLRLLEWLGQRWLTGQRAGVLPVLLTKLWIAALLLYLALRFLPVEVPGLVIGMGASLVALLWAAVYNQALLAEATERTSDA